MSVPHALLALLSAGPKYGLRLQTEFEARTGEVWPLNVGQVYTTLQRLERDGLVETDDGAGERSQKRYRITAAGEHELADWLRTPPDLVPPPRDELVIKVLVALQIPGTDVHEILQVHRRHVIEAMQRYTHIKAEAGEDDLALALVADAELFRLEAIVRWLDAADVRLKQRPSGAPAAPADIRSKQLRLWRSRNDQRTRTAPGIEDLRLRATEVHALRDVDLAVERGELVAIMGPSGSGKSTLLTIAGSLEEATSGQVLVDGVDLATVSRSDQAKLRRRSIGYVFQDFNLLPGLTAVENVTLPLELDGVGARPHGLPGSRRWRSSVSRIAPIASRTSSRAASASASRSPGRSSATRGPARGRADRRARLGERRGGHAPAAGRDPRRSRGVVVTHEAHLASWADRVVFLRDGHVIDETRRASRPGVAPRGRRPAMTTLAHRSALGGPKNGGVAARRAVVRWAWRMFRREWRQQVLVTGAPHGRGRGRDRQRHGRLQLGAAEDAEFGSAGHLLRFDGGDPRLVAAGLAAAEERLGTIDVIGHRSLTVPGGVNKVEFRAQDPGGVRWRALGAPPR